MWIFDDVKPLNTGLIVPWTGGNLGLACHRDGNKNRFQNFRKVFKAVLYSVYMDDNNSPILLRNQIFPTFPSE